MFPSGGVGSPARGTWYRDGMTKIGEVEIERMDSLDYLEQVSIFISARYIRFIWFTFPFAAQRG